MQGESTSASTDAKVLPIFMVGPEGRACTRVAMQPPLLLLLSQVFAGKWSAVRCWSGAIRPAPLPCHKQQGRLLRGKELWFPKVFLPALINKWLTGCLTRKLVLPIPFRVIFANPLTRHKSHPEQGRTDLRKLCRKKQTNKPFTASCSSITDCK